MWKSPLNRVAVAAAALIASVAVGAAVSATTGPLGGTTDAPAEAGVPADAPSDDTNTAAPDQSNAAETQAADTVVIAAPVASPELLEFFASGADQPAVRWTCRVALENDLIKELAPAGTDPNDYWLELDGERSPILDADGNPVLIGSGDDAFVWQEVDLTTATRVVLAALDGSTIVRSDVDQARVAEAFSPCFDDTTALQTVIDTGLADLASIYHEASANDDGSMQILLRVQKEPQFNDVVFEGEFEGTVPSADYDAFLNRMPETVRSQVEAYVDGVSDYVGS